MNWNLLSDHFIKAYKIDTNKEYETISVPAIQLLTKDRLDLIAKYKYVESYLTGKNKVFALELYKEHIGCMTAGAFSEDGDQYKNSINDYISSFNSLIETISKKGFDDSLSLVPVGANDTLLDGAHRVSICAYLGLNVTIVRFPCIKVANDAKYFINAGLGNFYLDYIVIEYSKLHDNVFACVFWPTGFASKNLPDRIISSYCDIVYSKTIDINKTAIRNFIIQIYCKNSWIGGFESHFIGATPQVEGCYNKVNKMVVYVVQASSLSRVQDCKAEVRKQYNVGNYSMHSSDNQSETQQILNLLLNENSLHLLKNGNPDKYIETNRLINDFKSLISNTSCSLNDYMIDGSTVLALYGLRPSDDLDYLCVKGGSVLANRISCHNDHSVYYNDCLENIIYNPNNYLYYNDCKVVSLSCLKKYKTNRNEKKDREDLRLIVAIDGKRSIKSYFNKLNSRIKFHTRNIRYYFPQLVIKVSRKIGIYSFLRKVYHKVKRKK